MKGRRRWGQVDRERIALEQLAASFEVYNKAVGKSPQTVDWYNRRLALFGRFVGDGCSLTDVTPTRVREFIVHLQEQTERHQNNPYVRPKEGKLSSAYIQGCVRALRAFASWLHAESYTETNRLQAVKPPKVQSKVIQVLTDEEIRRLLVRFDRDDPFGARNFTIVWTLLDCGLRASELCGLTTEDAHLEQGYLKVLGKGNKERLVPIGLGAQGALLRWRDYFRSQFLVSDAPHLFLDATGAGLTVGALEQVVKRAGIAAGIRRLTCHLLRHTFATNYLVRQVGDPLRLQQILGHTSLEMVRRYVSMANVQRSLIETRNSPMDLILAPQRGVRNARRLQPKRPRKLRLLK